jgi:hypothetical protein
LFWRQVEQLADGKQEMEEKGRAAKRRGEKGRRRRGRIGVSFAVGVAAEGRGRAGEQDGGVP